MRVIDFGRPVGAAHPPFIIGALDCRELATLDRALAAVDALADGQLDAVRFGRMSWDWAPRLFERAATRSLTMLGAPLDEDQVVRLDWLGAPALYLTFDWSDLDLVAAAARTGKPLVMQVGTASEVELAEVVETVHANGRGGIALVQSVIDVELEGLDALRRQGVAVGICDRSHGPAIPAAAITRGAAIVEKRFSLPPDSGALCPRELSNVVRECEQAWASLGDGRRAWAFN